MQKIRKICSGYHIGSHVSLKKFIPPDVKKVFIFKNKNGFITICYLSEIVNSLTPKEDLLLLLKPTFSDFLNYDIDLAENEARFINNLISEKIRQLFGIKLQEKKNI